MESSDYVNYVRIDLNSEVIVKLTATGVEINNNYYAKNAEQLINSSKEEFMNYWRADPKDNTIKRMLWEVMQVFGPHLDQGGLKPIEWIKWVIR